MLIIGGYCSKAGAQDGPFDGPPPICPRWALEPWVWEDYGNSDSSLLRLVNQYEAHEIPVGAVIIDSPWEAGDGKISALEIYDNDNKDDWSFRYNLQPSDRQYGDRSYLFTSIPEDVVGAQWFRTANDSKTYTGDDIASFTLMTDATVYIAHDTRIVQKPDWLSGWQPVGSTIENNESPPTVYELFINELSKDDEISLGPNTEDGSSNCGMYTVIVKTEDEDWTQYNTYEWNEHRYPEPATIIDDLHNRDIRVVLWVTGIINERSKLYSTVWDNYCYPNQDPNHNPVTEKCATADWWKDGGNLNSIHIDFRKPEVRNWFADIVAPLMQSDFDGFKCDAGADKYYFEQDSLEDINGTDLRNYYYDTFYQLAKGQKPEGIIVSRASSHQLQNPDGVGAPISASPISWQGDFCGNFTGLRKQMKYVYTSAEMGYAAPGVEVGGYPICTHGISKASLIRYAQFGALTPLMDNGGLDKDHEPWRHGKETVKIYRYYATLHSELVPYLFSYGVEAHRTRTSILRGIDPIIEDGGEIVDYEPHHKLGEELFVSLVTSDADSKEVVLPEGVRWIDYWNEDQVFAGGTRVTYDLDWKAGEDINCSDAEEDNLMIDNMKFPIFIRTGAIVPMNVRNNGTCHGFNEGEHGGLPGVGTYPDNVEPSEVQADITLNIYPAGQSEFLFHHPTGDDTRCSDIKIDVDEIEGTIDVYEIPLDNRHVDDETGEAICGETKAGYDFILRVKSFAKPSTVTASGADAFKWFYRPKDYLIIVCVRGKDFTLNISDLYGYGLISNLEVNDSENEDDWSIQYNLSVGDQQYGDRNYAFTIVPDIVAGAQWIRTANDSKTYADDEVASFTLGADATVYIAHDERVSDKPDWLGDWVSLADFLQNDEQTPVRFELFRKEFAMGDIVSLGPNTEQGISYGMYSVIIVP
jgi:alpha-D-xyloside xylohydrolase